MTDPLKPAPYSMQTVVFRGPSLADDGADWGAHWDVLMRDIFATGQPTEVQDMNPKPKQDRSHYQRRDPLTYAEIAAVFRSSATAKEAGERLGLSTTGARSLRARLRGMLDPATGKAFDVGTTPTGRPRWPRVTP